MKFTEDQAKQVRENIEKIRDYLVSRISEMEEVGLRCIDISFSGDAADHTLCYVCVRANGVIDGKYGKLNLYFDPENKGYMCDTAAWGYPKYAISLMREWQLVKQRFDEQIQARRETNALIDNFEI